MIGNYAIAASATNDSQLMARARASLAELAHQEGATTYWNLEANASPFYGWGDAGRIETTALAVQALAALSERDEDAKDQVSPRSSISALAQGSVSRWYSTHATLSAVEALAAAIPQGNDKGESSKAEVTVNGHRVSSVELPAAKDVVGAIAIDLNEFLRAGTNIVQVVRPTNGAPMKAQAITSYYVPWQNSSATLEDNVQRGDTRALRLNVHYDQIKPKVNESIRCDVQVARIGFAGYGMMVAEIGLPPGAEVDRRNHCRIRGSNTRFVLIELSSMFGLLREEPRSALVSRLGIEWTPRHRRRLYTTTTTRKPTRRSRPFDLRFGED